jgi:hypothetical protein
MTLAESLWLLGKEVNFVSIDVDALELLPAQDGDEAVVGYVTACDYFTYCADTCTRG